MSCNFVFTLKPLLLSYALSPHISLLCVTYVMQLYTHIETIIIKLCLVSTYLIIMCNIMGDTKNINMACMCLLHSLLIFWPILMCNTTMERYCQLDLLINKGGGWSTLITANIELLQLFSFLEQPLHFNE